MRTPLYQFNFQNGQKFRCRRPTAGGDFVKKTLIALMIGGLAAFAAYGQDTAKDDLKKSGQDVKQAGKDTGHAAKNAGKSVKKGTKKAVHKTAQETKKGADKVEDKTK
jgi:hypothetical protein